MRLLSGSTRLAGLLIATFMLATTLPASWSGFGSYFGPGATSAWAGSPDETLGPQPQPPPKQGATIVTYESSATDASSSRMIESSESMTGWSWTERFGFAWSYYLSKVLRF